MKFTATQELDHRSLWLQKVPDLVYYTLSLLHYVLMTHCLYVSVRFKPHTSSHSRCKFADVFQGNIDDVVVKCCLIEHRYRITITIQNINLNGFC